MSPPSAWCWGAGREQRGGGPHPSHPPFSIILARRSPGSVSCPPCSTRPLAAEHPRDPVPHEWWPRVLPQGQAPLEELLWVADKGGELIHLPSPPGRWGQWDGGGEGEATGASPSSLPASAPRRQHPHPAVTQGSASLITFGASLSPFSWHGAAGTPSLPWLLASPAGMWWDQGDGTRALPAHTVLVVFPGTRRAPS